MDWEPMDIWRFYNQRACLENYIKESKYGFSMDKTVDPISYQP